MGLEVQEVEGLATSWQLALRAQRKSPQTLRTYGEGVRQYLAWCTENDVEPMTRSSLNLFTAGLLDGGAAASTARSRQLGVRRFAAWLAEEGEIPADPFLGIKSPKLDEKVIEPLSDDQLRAMLKACVPPKDAEPKVALRHRRDEAMVRLMLETGMRAGEVVALQLDDLDLAGGLVTVTRGKGGKGRVAPFGPRPRSRSTATCGCAAPTASPSAPTSGSGTAAKASPMTRCTRRWGSEPRPLASRASTRTAPAHRRAPLAGRGWFGGWAHGRGRLDSSRHAHALHQGAGVGARR